MSLLDLPKTVLRLQYRFVRFPLSMIEQQMRSLPRQSPPRVAYERGLGILDGVVGHLLDDPAIASRGATTAARNETIRRPEPSTTSRPTTPVATPPAPAPKPAPAATAPTPEAAAPAPPKAKTEPTTPKPKPKPAAPKAKTEPTAPKAKSSPAPKAEADTEPEKIPLAEAVAEQLEAKKAEEKAHNEDNTPPHPN